MKKILAGGILLISFLFVIPVFAQPAQAAQLEFDAAATTLSVGETVDVEVIVNAAGEKITSMDAYVLYDSSVLQAQNDSSVLQAQSVTDGVFFPTVFNDITTQRVYVAGLVEDPSTFKENSGTVATITFKALKEGTVTLSYKCDGTTESSKVIKNDFNATNIIDCSKNGTVALTVGAGGATTTATTTTPAPTELPQSGVMDNLVKYASVGTVLLVVGFALKFLL